MRKNLHADMIWLTAKRVSDHLGCVALLLKDVLWTNSGGPYHTKPELPVGGCSPGVLGPFGGELSWFLSAFI